MGVTDTTTPADAPVVAWDERTLAEQAALQAGLEIGEDVGQLYWRPDVRSLVRRNANGSDSLWSPAVGFGIIDPDYARVFTIARCLAWQEGYALMMHGSFTRDLDLVAVPWAERCCEPEHLVKRIEDAAGLKLTGHPPTDKGHGRFAWTLLFPKFADPRFVDLSVFQSYERIVADLREQLQAAPLFQRIVDGMGAQVEAESKIAEILGVELLGISFDDYDSSFEIFPWHDVVDVAPTQEQHDAILALGCQRYWINFPDDTERYCLGERKPAAIKGRYERHNQYKDVKRSTEAQLQAAEQDALRYRWLRNCLWNQEPNGFTGERSWLWSTRFASGYEQSGDLDCVTQGQELDAAIDARIAEEADTARTKEPT